MADSIFLSGAYITHYSIECYFNFIYKEEVHNA